MTIYIDSEREVNAGGEWRPKDESMATAMAFDLSAFIQQYFVNQMWDRTGYNIFNTSVYALIALIALYLIWQAFKKYKIEIDSTFWMTALVWTVWGSSIRVITDSIDGGKMMQTVAGSSSTLFSPLAHFAYPIILNSHLLDYGWLTVTPGIYVLTAALFLGSWAIARKMKMPQASAWLGGLLAALNLLMLLPMAQNWMFALVAVGLGGGVGVLLWFGLKWREQQQLLPVLGHALDGAATWVTIDWFGPAIGVNYFEQHVLANYIASISPLKFGLFFLLKVGLSIGMVHLIRKMAKDKELDGQTANLVLLVIAILGFAPGLRDLLRMLCGT